MREDLPGEIWRPVVGLEDKYEVSSLGRVWSIPRLFRPGQRGQRWVGGIFRATPVGPHGYPRVWLPPGRTPYLHKVVTEAFLGPRPEGMQVRHLDGNPLNCTLANLRYGTVSENKLDQVAHGTHKYASRTACSRGHIYDEANTRHSAAKGRQCRTCEREYRRGYVERNREVVNAKRRKASRTEPGSPDPRPS